jgi:hypothetical protein
MRAALRGRRNIVEKKMFGGYCWMLRGNMLCGVEVGRYMFRIGPDLEAEALKRPGVKPMDITGPPMRGFIWVDARRAEGPALRDWIEFAASYVRSIQWSEQRSAP